MPASTTPLSDMFSLLCSRRAGSSAQPSCAHARSCRCPATAMRSTTQPRHPPPRPSHCPAAIDDSLGRYIGLHLRPASACALLPDQRPDQLLHRPNAPPPRPTPPPRSTATSVWALHDAALASILIADPRQPTAARCYYWPTPSLQFSFKFSLYASNVQFDS
jgi:hypothetical protein